MRMTIIISIKKACYANAHRGRVRKAGMNPLVLRIAEELLTGLPPKNKLFFS
jgi:hypothetical protein